MSWRFSSTHRGFSQKLSSLTQKNCDSVEMSSSQSQLKQSQLKAITAMIKLYIGNLPTEVDEAAVRQLFSDHSLAVADISLKRGGYAFVDFLDQSAADRAIDKLHGYSYCGSPLIVEPSVANKKLMNSMSAHELGEAQSQLADDIGCEASSGDCSRGEYNNDSYNLALTPLFGDTILYDMNKACCAISSVYFLCGDRAVKYRKCEISDANAS